MLLEAVVAVRDLGRLREIGSVFIEYGFGDIVQRTGIRRMLAKAGHVLHLRKSAEVDEKTTAMRARQALETLGPSFVKLGQLLASRPDLLPPEWIAEFSELHARVSPVPFDDLRAMVESGLGVPAGVAFASFDEEPLAAGSIAQVHGAQLRDGRDVVVKIRRPGIVESIAADLRLLARLAHILEHENREIARYRPRQIARDLARTMRAELDMRAEARNLKVVARNLVDRDDVVVPTVIDEWTSRDILVMTRLRGQSASDWVRAGRPSDGFEPRRIAAVGADVLVRMIFGDGVFHADPHPGNLMFLEDGRLGLLDFGQIGRLSEGRRRELVILLGSAVTHDEDGVVDVLLGWTDGQRSVDIGELTEDVRSFVSRYEGLPLQQMDVTELLGDITEIVRENEIVLPADIALLIKVFLTLEGLGRALDPQFRLSERMEPVIAELVRRERSPRRILRRGLRDLHALLARLPSDVRDVAKRIRRGDFQIDFDVRRLDDFGHRVERAANRVTVGTVTAALIVGTAIVMTTDRGPTVFGLPLLGLLGFTTSAAIGLGLLWSILRSGK